MAMKLHFHPNSSFSRRVLIALIEKGITYEKQIVDMYAGKHREPAYLALNPYGRVPVLEEDGFVIFESTAILNYLETTRPTPALTPHDAKGRALVDMHMKLCDIQMTRHTTTITIPKRNFPKETWNEKAMAEAKAEIEKHLAILDGQLAGKAYLVAETFTLADLCYLPVLQFLPLMEIVPPPHVAGWVERLLARPSALETIPTK